MSWSFPHWFEHDDGPVTVQSPDFPDRESALTAAVEHHGWDAIDEGTVRVVAAYDRDEER